MPLIDLNQHSVAILVFAMHECPACEHYVPRLVEQVGVMRDRGAPLVVYDEGVTVDPGSIPVLVYDAASPSADVQKLADRFQVEATPTTIVLAKQGSFKCEGNLANNQILWLLNMANEANDGADITEENP